MYHGQIPMVKHHQLVPARYVLEANSPAGRPRCRALRAAADAMMPWI